MIQIQKLFLSNIKTPVSILGRSKTGYVTVKENSATPTVGFTTGIGNTAPWMATEDCIILTSNQRMREIGKITRFLVKVQFIMKNQSHLIILLITQILTIYKSTGKSTMENSKMTTKKALVHFTLSMGRNTLDNLIMT